MDKDVTIFLSSGSSSIQEQQPLDVQTFWSHVGKICDGNNKLKYQNVCNFANQMLCLPLSNVKCKQSSLGSGELRNLLGKLKKKLESKRHGQGQENRRPSKCRRRSTSSSCSIPSDKENKRYLHVTPRYRSLKIEFVEISSLHTEILKVLGQQNTCTTPEAQPHEDRWSSILTSGLPSEKKQPLLQKYPRFNNCHLISPPPLNPEIKSAINESSVGPGLYALGIGLTSILNKNSESVNPEDLALIETLSDAARLLPDAQLRSSRQETKVQSQGFFKLEASIQPATSTKWTETTPEQASGHNSENNSKLPSPEAKGKGEVGQAPLGSKVRVKAVILSKHMDTWCNITSDRAILSWIEGDRLPFIAHVPQVDNSYTGSWSKSETSNINSEIHRLLHMGAIIVECKPTRNQFISPIFLIKNPMANGSKESKLIFVTRSFQVRGHTALKLISKNCFLLSVELKDAYFLIKVNVSHRKYLRLLQSYVKSL
nr:unnamed protein product [Callosobruchus analis]